MRKIFFFSAILMLVVVFTACEDDDYSFKPANTVRADVSSITIFDTSFPVNFSTSNTNVDEIIISGGAISERAVSISDQSGSATFTAADFGDAWKIDGGVRFSSTIDFGSSKSVSGFSISVVEALAAEVSAATMYEYDSAKVYLSSEGATAFSNMATVMVEAAVKNAEITDPVFEEVFSATNVMEFEKIDSIMGVDFELGDTIVYRVTATGSGYEESKTIELPVASKTLPGLKTDMLSTSSASFAFMPAKEEDDSDVGVVSFDAPAGFSSSDVMFIEVEEGAQVEKFAELDKFSTLVGIVDDATLVSSITDVMIGKVYAFKYTYMVWEYYGYIKIQDVQSTAIGDSENGFEFSYTQDVKY
nr:hypothetical protein [uncultured Carboxylicivirga sp.]